MGREHALGWPRRRLRRPRRLTTRRECEISHAVSQPAHIDRLVESFLDNNVKIRCTTQGVNMTAVDATALTAEELQAKAGTASSKATGRRTSTFATSSRRTTPRTPVTSPSWPTRPTRPSTCGSTSTTTTWRSSASSASTMSTPTSRPASTPSRPVTSIPPRSTTSLSACRPTSPASVR